MKNKKAFTVAAAIFNIICLIALTAAVFFAPYAMQFFINRGVFQRSSLTATLAFFHSCVPFLYAILAIALKLTLDSVRGKCRPSSGLLMLRLIWLCSIAVFLISAVAGFFMPIFFTVSVSACFVGLMIKAAETFFCSLTEEASTVGAGTGDNE